MTLTLDAPPEVEIVVMPEEEHEVPCFIADSCRSSWCATTSDHGADVMVLWSCGCTRPYCETALNSFVKKFSEEGVTTFCGLRGTFVESFPLR